MVVIFFWATFVLPCNSLLLYYLPIYLRTNTSELSRERKTFAREGKNIVT